MTIKDGVNTATMQNSSLKRDGVKEMPEALNNKGLNIEPKEQQGQIKSYSTFLGTNIDIRV